ncbi:hypothetical protein A1O1_09271 [Capronia coronata CBS 617.96]|uniref:YMC020W-like alpha/beta hydrolase domain-containing protein n=1 Tax=Capronia coronata CBS 617.96 TaxID=1182541 RepID=W9Y929_9EURO|nr:uncharacterized protein A1O1_09271 [Capronia coronata CBS 617.96]EXJ78869.1 hypothetical protein A1O1_09271 [Capronia coronata CBS 617.96]
MTLGRSNANRSLPVNATTTIVNATSESASPSSSKRSQSDISRSANGESAEEGPSRTAEERPEKTDQQERGSTPPAEDIKPPSKGEQTQASQSTWLGWLSRRDAATSEAAGGEVQQPALKPGTIPAPTPPTSTAGMSDAQSATDEQPKEEGLNVNNKRSWYYMWSGNTSDRPTKMDGPSPNNAPSPVSESPEATKGQTESLAIPAGISNSKSTSQASSLETAPPPRLREDGTKSSGWVFWSRDKKRPSSMQTENEPHVGEIAVSDTPSQTRPRRASISLQEESTKPAVAHKVVGLQQALADQRQAPKSLKLQRKPSASIDDSATKLETSTAAAASRDPIEVGTPRTASPAPSKMESPNLLLPPIKATLNYEETPSILQQLARLLYYTKEPELTHLSLTRNPPRIKNALAIGVHGYFPAPLIRTVLGQPTGTSIKFADMAAKCIKKWTRNHGYDCEVKSAALEGEGRIAERVELLWKLLLNWIDEIRRSDFVMIACHSQGVPVAIMLVAKLLQFGCISAARVGICAMAGVNMGPFQEYKSRWISGSAGELFEFSDPNSKVSKEYASALDVVLRSGLVKLTFVGSIDDQLVSMESSIYAPISHPHIYRAVFIDSRIHTPNFLAHLVGFSLKLRNVGVPDHGLIRELSSPLAGSLYGGEGHSRIYEDDAVYDIAIAFALETNAFPDVPVSRRPIGNSGTNPYILPFAMRGILEEDYVKKELQEEAQELLAQFDDWKPMTKALKDVKFRLEGIRSKL